MTKRIAQHGQSPPVEESRLVLKPCSGRHGAFNSHANIRNFKVEMHRRPMPMIVASRRSLRPRQGSRWFRQQIDHRRGTEHLRDRAAEKPAAEMKAECSPVEFDGAFNVVDIHVHEKLHHAIFASLWLLGAFEYHIHFPRSLAQFGRGTVGKPAGRANGQCIGSQAS